MILWKKNKNITSRCKINEWFDFLISHFTHFLSINIALLRISIGHKIRLMHHADDDDDVVAASDEQQVALHSVN